MEKKTFWVIAGIAIAVLLAVVIWQTMQISSVTSAAQSAGSSSAVSSSGMVGGC